MAKIEEVKKDAVKVEAPAAVKPEAAAPAKKAPAKKPAAKKAPAKKAVAKKAPAKKAAPAKEPAAKAGEEFVIQFGGAEWTVADIKAKVLAAAGAKRARNVQVYVKPEDRKAYYVIGKKSGAVEL